MSSPQVPFPLHEHDTNDKSPPFSMIPDTPPPARHLIVLHAPIRAYMTKLLSNIRHLTALSPDAYVDDVDRRVHVLSQTTLAHCIVRDDVIIPLLKSAAAVSTDSTLERPAKRPRTSSPAARAVQLASLSRDHFRLTDAFDGLRDALAQLRAAPMLAEEAWRRHGGRADVLTLMRRKEKALSEVLDAHLTNSELLVLPMCVRLLDVGEQGSLMVKCMRAFAETSSLSEAFRFVEVDKLAAVFEELVKYAALDDLRRITTAVADVLPSEHWNSICRRAPEVKGLVTLKYDPLIEIVHLHKAIAYELKDIVDYCCGIVVTDLKQLQSLATRMHFLRRVHSCHSDGEDTVLLKELNVKLASSPCGVDAVQLQEDHDDEEALFQQFELKVRRLQAEVRSSAQGCGPVPESRKDELVRLVKAISDHIIGHMQGEETKILPLVQKHFSLADQDRIMRQVMGKVPSEFLHELIPWMFGFLSVDEQESLLRNLLRTAPHDEIRKVVGAIALSVQKGMTDRMQWNEICLRVPEVEEEYKTIADNDSTSEIGPVSEVLRVHKAFRIELQSLLRRAKQIPTDGSLPNPTTLSSLAESVSFLQRMVAEHSRAEDNILLPRLEQRVHGISEKYKEDHCDERKLFKDLAKCLEELRCLGDEASCAPQVHKLQNVARTLRDEMINHLDLEEKQMWPQLTKNFSEEEQSEIVALLFGQMPGGLLRDLLPWMIRLFSVSERNTMMNHILQITKSTMFQTWLKTWLPIEGENYGLGSSARTAERQNRHPEKDRLKSFVKTEQQSKRSLDNSHSGTALILLHGRDNMERTMRSIARDESLSARDRTMMMQQIMLAPYNELCANVAAASRVKHDDKQDRAPTYTKGTDRLGCDHYLRACKLRAACCNRLYTCRLCHDASETHIMDRASTTEILCMRCDTLQSVSRTCVNENCQQQFAKYFCEVCIFYDDMKERSIYHCHSCNVCRVGKGLGQDFFHCMKCNQCMSMKYQEGHACVENSMESDCPVCFQYMFTSTRPVKYLRCGHLMHVNCFKQYQRTNVRCPLCSKSLAEMTSLYKQIDKNLAAAGNSMPWQYRTARCDIFCHDCQMSSNTAYHFLYNKCPNCSSYNTRVDRIDANATDRERS